MPAPSSPKGGKELTPPHGSSDRESLLPPMSPPPTPTCKLWEQRQQGSHPGPHPLQVLSGEGVSEEGGPTRHPLSCL